MTKNQINEIRERQWAAEVAVETLRKQLGNLVALNVLDKQIREIPKLLDTQIELKSELVQETSLRYEAEEVRDRLQVRCEALKEANRGGCEFCVYLNNPQGGCRSLRNKCRRYEFDKARFAEVPDDKL